MILGLRVKFVLGNLSLPKTLWVLAVNWSVTLSPFRLPNLMHPPASEHTRLWQPMEEKIGSLEPFPILQFLPGPLPSWELGFPPITTELQGERPEPGFQTVALLPVVFLLLGNDEEIQEENVPGPLPEMPSLALFCSL